ncbi:MAG: MATE family efflux transporter, partial [Planctomycetota bacterium]|nr:MATE family efflux transporter [Planctomycetota bacterium]
MSDPDESVPEPPREPSDYAAESSSAASPDDPGSALGGVLEQEALIEAEGRIRSGKLAGRSLLSAILVVAIPVLFQQSMAATVGLFDKILAGRLPDRIVEPALDAIGIGSYISWLVGIAMAGLGIGGQVIIARAMGSGDPKDAHDALGQSIGLALIWGSLVGLVLWLLVAPLAAISDLTPEATELLGEYVLTIAFSMPLCGVLMVGSMCLYGAGETVLPALIMVAVNAVNVVCSWLLSGVDVGIGGFELVNPTGIDALTSGVAGIAGGTALSYLTGAGLIVLCLMRGVRDLSLRPTAMRPTRLMFGRILRIGVPSFLEGLSMWGVNVFVLGFIGIIVATNRETGAGPVEGLVGAHAVAIQWEAFSFMPGFALGTAAGTIAGQFLGAGNVRMARKAIITCTVIGMSFMGLVGVAFILFGSALTRLISDQPVLLEEVPKLLVICGSIQVFFALNMVVRQGLRGVGDTRWTLIITTVSSYGVRLPLAYLLGVVLGGGLPGIWLGLCGEIVVRGLLFTARFLH